MACGIDLAWLIYLHDDYLSLSVQEKIQISVGDGGVGGVGGILIMPLLNELLANINFWGELQLRPDVHRITVHTLTSLPNQPA